MRALRYLLITFAVMMVISISAQSLAQQPSADFHSTSSMVTSGSTLPQAAQSGAYTTYDEGYNPSRANTPGIRGGFNPGGGSGEPDDREEPWYTPIGEGMWPLLFCAAVFSGVIAFRRKRQQRNV